MRILVDMNLSPLWIDFFKSHGYAAVHWQSIGAPNAPDSELMAWARTHGYIVFTEDLDFTHMIALTQAKSPSILQVRTMDNLPKTIGQTILAALQQFQDSLLSGAIVVVDQQRARARLLPFRN